MPRLSFRVKLFSSFVLIGLLLSLPGIETITAYAQQPTGSIATVTGTLIGLFLMVNADQDQINVRGGPGTDYAAVGVLVTGEFGSA